MRLVAARPRLGQHDAPVGIDGFKRNNLIKTVGCRDFGE
jgi:hypothetical protein